MINKINIVESSEQEVFEVLLKHYKTPTSGTKSIPENSKEENEPSHSPVLTKRKSIFSKNSSQHKRSKVVGTAISMPINPKPADVSGFAESPFGKLNRKLIENSCFVETQQNDLPLSPVLGGDRENPLAVPVTNTPPLSPILCKSIEDNIFKNCSVPSISTQLKLKSSCDQENQTITDASSFKTPVKSVLDSEHNQHDELFSQTNSPVLGHSMLKKPSIPSCKEQSDVTSQASPVLSSKCKTNGLFNKKKSFTLKNVTCNMNKGEMLQTIDSSHVLATPSHKSNKHQRNTSSTGIDSKRKKRKESSLTEQEQSKSPIVSFKNNYKLNQVQDLQTVQGMEIPVSPVLGNISLSFQLNVSSKAAPTCSKLLVSEEHDYSFKTTKFSQINSTALNIDTSKRVLPDEKTTENIRQNTPTINNYTCNQSAFKFISQPKICPNELMLNYCIEVKSDKGKIPVQENSENYLNRKEECTKNQYFNLGTTLNSPSFNSDLEISKFPLSFLHIGEIISSPWNTVTKTQEFNKEVETVSTEVIKRISDQGTNKSSKTDIGCSSENESEQSERVGKGNSSHSSCDQIKRKYDVNSRKCERNVFQKQSKSGKSKHSNLRDEVQPETNKTCSNQQVDTKSLKLKTAKKNLNVIYDLMRGNGTELQCNANTTTSLNQDKVSLEEEMGSSFLKDIEKPLVLNKDEMSKVSVFLCITPFRSHLFSGLFFIQITCILSIKKYTLTIKKNYFKIKINIIFILIF